MEIAYGHTITSDDDEYLELIANTNRVLAEAGDIGSSIVDLIPIGEHNYPHHARYLMTSVFK